MFNNLIQNIKTSDINMNNENGNNFYDENEDYQYDKEILVFNDTNRKHNKLPGSLLLEDYYKDKTIFITGSTGFLGALLLEKLLRSFKNIKKIFLIIRDNTKSYNKKENIKVEHLINERIKDYFDDEIFTKMKLENKDYYKKIKIIIGDVGEDDFAVSRTDKEMIINETDIVFHVAATVLFNERISRAYKINVKGTKTMLEWSKQMKNLQSFIYISTAYSNSHLKHIEEKFYKPNYTEDELKTLVTHSTDEELSLLTEHILENKPNTYTLTKCTAEHIVEQYMDDLPIIVFRPSIVMPTLNQPLPLWMKGFNGILAMSAGSGVGFTRVTLRKRGVITDIVPADKVTNCLIYLPVYNQNVHLFKSKNDKIINYVSTNMNPFHQDYITDISFRSVYDFEESSPMMIWAPYYYETDQKWLYILLFYFCHLIPGVIFNIIEKITNRPKIIMKIYRKIFFLTNTLNYFALNQWSFNDMNLVKMINHTKDSLDYEYDFNLRHIDWIHYCSFIPRCVCKYFLKTPLNKECFNKKLKPMIIIDEFAWFLLKVFLCYHILTFISNILNNVVLLN